MASVKLECINKHKWEMEIPMFDTTTNCPQCGKHAIKLDGKKMVDGKEIRTIRGRWKNDETKIQ